MIEPFWGEFLISPIPLELSLNYCSHKCAYCFANLNDPKRVGDVKQIMRFLTSYQSRETIEAVLLKEGYPVCISNRSDPFAHSNYRQMLPIMQAMVELEIPLQIQTKGGPGVSGALEFLPPSVWYISISTLDDAIRRKVEPGAPDIDSRFELMEAIRAKGGRVILGLNPCVPEWLPDPLPLLQRAKDAGAEGVWVEELHLNYRQVGNLSQAEKAALGVDLIARSQKKARDAMDSDAFFAAREAAAGLGLHVFSNGQPTYSKIWDIYREVYSNTFFTNQDFVNYCFDNGLHEKILPFEMWQQVVGQGLPGGKYRMSKYIGASAMSLWETHNIPSKLSYTELLGIIWATYRAKQCPARMPSFSLAAMMAETGWIMLVNEKELPYVVFDEKGAFTSYYTAVVPEWATEQTEG